MPNPFVLAGRGLDMAVDIFRLGRLSWNEARAASGAGAVDTLKGLGRSVIRGSRNAAGWAAGSAPGAAAGVAQAGKWLTGTSQGRRLGIMGGAAALGWATSSSDATTWDKVQRAAGFGILGELGVNAAGRGRYFKAAGAAVTAGEGARAMRFASKGLGMPAQWGMAHSAAAGAVYGMISPNTSIMGGAAFGAIAHLGLRGGTGTMSTREAPAMGFAATNAQQSWFKRVTGQITVGRAARAGMVIGAYSQLDTNDSSGLGVIKGGAIGGVIGGAGGGAAKFAIKHPWLSVIGVSAAGQFGVAGLEAGGMISQAGSPGFDTMNADGDLALALHKLRHGG